MKSITNYLLAPSSIYKSVTKGAVILTHIVCILLCIVVAIATNKEKVTGEPTTPPLKTPQNEHTTTNIVRRHTRHHFRLRTRCQRIRRRKAVQDKKTGSRPTQDLERRGNGIQKEYRCRLCALYRHRPEIPLHMGL